MEKGQSLWWMVLFGGIKTLVEIIMVILTGCLLIPCLVPLMINIIKSFIKTMVEKKTVTHLLLIKGYQQIMMDDDLSWVQMHTEHQEGGMK